MKTKETFLEAIQNGAYVNIETKREIEWLRELPIEKAFGVGLRVNINVSKISQEDAKYDDDFGRFGFSDETSDFEDAIRQISSLPNINLSGIHIHRMSRLCQNIAQPLFS
jgi:diaminopimelate decarboxylase